MKVYEILFHLKQWRSAL